MNDKLIVKGIELTTIKKGDEIYISLTDMIRAKDGDFFISDWLRNRNSVDYLGIEELFIIPILIMANMP